MKRPVLIITAIFFLLATLGAKEKKSAPAQLAEMAKMEESMNITLTIGNKTFSANLEDNETSLELVKSFPLTLKMSELNGNEYYKYLESDFPTQSKNPRAINAGDIKLYGSNCLVIFYKSFSTSYKYTSLGKINDAEDLEEALKSSGGKVVLELGF